MRAIALAGFVITALAAAAPGARAGADSTYRGGCSLVAAPDQMAGGGQMTGEIDIEAVVYSSSDPATPVSATITCHVTVNGAEQPGALVRESGTGAVVGGGVVTYTSGQPNDDVELCQSVDYTGEDDSTQTAESCVDVFQPDVLDPASGPDPRITVGCAAPACPPGEAG